MKLTLRKPNDWHLHASLNGPKHYGLAPNSETITLEQSSWSAPEDVRVDGPDERALVYRGGETIEWRVA